MGIYGGGNGYKGQSMSNNAVQAYNDGEKPISKITSSDLKKLRGDVKFPLSAFKKYCKTRCTSISHHTSKHFNNTQFFDIDSIINDLNEMSTEEITEIIASLTKSEKEKKEKSIVEENANKHFAVVKVTTWIGKHRNHQRPVDEILTGYIIDNWFYIQSEAEFCEAKKKNLNADGTQVLYKTKYLKTNSKKIKDLLAQLKKLGKLQKKTSKDSITISYTIEINDAAKEIEKEYGDALYNILIGQKANLGEQIFNYASIRVSVENNYKYLSFCKSI